MDGPPPSRDERRSSSRRAVVVAAAAALIVVVIGAGTAVSTGKWRVWPNPDDVRDGVEPVRVGPELTLAEGTINGVDWRVTAFGETRGDVCMHFETIRWKAGGCGFVVPAERALSYMSDALEPDMFPELRRPVQFGYGPISEDVARVKLTLEDGREIEVEPIDAKGLDVNAFVATWKGDAGVRSVVVYAASGDELGRTSPP
ncbi:MAG: hypothetical protein M3N24_05465 [Actinomycetota bacterium]|nr:hypothetical protein [Actinomycetota bacterium]